MTAEEDRVAVEVEGEGRLRDGVVYRMNYHFLLVSVMDSSTRSKNTVTPQ
jgi:ketosteroid isomerase-like protein